MTNATPAAAPAVTRREMWERFRERRNASVMQPQGFLALTTTQWVTGTSEEPETIWGVPGQWAIAPEGERGLRVFAHASDGIHIDGELLDGSALVRGKDDVNSSTIVLSESATATVISGDAGYALRVWDTQAEALRDFGAIDVFDYNPAWIIQGTFIPAESGATVDVSHIKEDAARAVETPGEIVVSIGGTEYRLAAIPSGRALQIVFADATSGESSYSVGRFLFVAPQPDGTVTLDFNLAVLPPCAFSYAFNCPMPPAQNRIAIAIEAGEKNVLNKQGELLHG